MDIEQYRKNQNQGMRNEIIKYMIWGAGYQHKKGMTIGRKLNHLFMYDKRSQRYIN